VSSAGATAPRVLPESGGRNQKAVGNATVGQGRLARPLPQPAQALGRTDRGPPHRPSDQRSCRRVARL